MNELTVCKHCGSSEDVVKFGTYKGTQLYWCKVCQRKFKADNDLFHMKVPAEYVSSALDAYYKGLSIGDVCDHLKQEHNYAPSKSVVFKWVDKYTAKAVEHFRDYHPTHVGDTWICDETMLDIDGRKVWFWDCIDADTRFLLASRVSLTRTTDDAEALIKAAHRKAGKAPKAILTDKLRAYLDGVELTFGRDTEHIQTGPFAKGEDSTRLIERFHGTLKDRTKVMRGFRDMDTLIEFTDGFLVYYNYFRPNEALGGKTPAEAARVKYDAHNWAELARLPVSKQEEIATHRILQSKPRVTKTRLVMVPKKRRAKRAKRVSTGLSVMTMRKG